MATKPKTRSTAKWPAHLRMQADYAVAKLSRTLSDRERIAIITHNACIRENARMAEEYKAGKAFSNNDQLKRKSWAEHNVTLIEKSARIITDEMGLKVSKTGGIQIDAPKK
jgi:hypothetical protein